MLLAQFGSINVQHMQHNIHVSRLVRRENVASFSQLNQIFTANTPYAPYTTRLGKNTLGVALTCPSIGLCDNVTEVPTCQATQQNENAEGSTCQLVANLGCILL